MEDDDGSTKQVKPEWRVLHYRLNRPAGELSFWTFLGVGILILGGMAVWIEGFRYFAEVPKPNEAADLGPLQLALATAGLAIAGPSAMQMLYSRDKLAIVVAIILFTIEMIGAMYLMVFGKPDGCETFLAGLVCLVVAVGAWWLANGHDDIFQDETPIDAPAGGNPMRALASGNSPAKV